MKKAAIIITAMMVVTILGGCSHGQKTTENPSDWQSVGYNGARWWAESAKLTSEQRDELSDMTPDIPCSNCSATWNTRTLRWEEDVEGEHYFEGKPLHKPLVGPHAILPFALALSEEKDAQWCDPKMEPGIDINGIPFRCVIDAKSPHPDRMGRFEEDKAAEEAMAEYEARKEFLAQAMTTRVLTSAEYKEVLADGSNLLVHAMQPFNQQDIDEQFEHMLRIQDDLRANARITP